MRHSLLCDVGTSTPLWWFNIVNCQKACKKCDDERPCGRCVRLNIESKCVDKARKDRSNLKPVSTKGKKNQFIVFYGRPFMASI